MKALIEKNMAPDPFVEFLEWYELALHHPKIKQGDAMCLSTVDRAGYPTSRMVLLKAFDHRGFVFYTNFRSHKGHDLKLHPKASLNFYWEALNRQIRITGKVESVTAEEADEYFQSRPRASQIGAWASHQSEALKNREELEKRFAEYQKKFRGKVVPRPLHWSGFRVIPQRIEFWQARPNRLHDRIVYLLKKGKWRKERLSP